MGRWTADRLAATSGIGFVALFLVSFFVATEPPNASASNAEWVAYFLDNHRQTLVGSVLLGAAVMFFLWWSGSLASALRTAGQQRLGTVALGGGITTAGLAFVLGAITGGIAYRIATDSPSQVKGFVDVAYAAQALISFPIAVMIGASAIGAWRTLLFPRWWAGVSGAAAVVVVSGGGALAHSGFYRPDGPWSFVVLIVFLIWTLVTSGWLAWRTVGEPVAEAAPAH